MDLTTGFLIYALFFRLAIIATGIVSIVLGYKLFAHGIKCRGETNVDVEAGEFKIRFDSIGSGALFALFGATIIVFMLSQGNPELLIKNVQLVTKGSPQDSSPTKMRIGSVALKGGNDNKASEALQRFNQAFDEAVQQQQDGNAEAAIKNYNRALLESEVSLAKAGAVFNELAWVYREQGRTDEALALARVATTVDKESPAYFDTLALILMDLGEHKGAEQAAKTAVELNPADQEHQKTLQQVREAQRARQ